MEFPFIVVVSWALVIAAALAAWSRFTRKLSIALWAGGYAVAAYAGLLSVQVLPVVVALGGTGWCIHSLPDGGGRVAALALFGCLATLLALHILPGFHNFRLIGPASISDDAVPFTMYFNLDKALILFWLLWWQRSLIEARSWKRTVTVAVCSIVGVAAACVPLAFWLNAVRLDLKFPAETWVWLLNQIVLVAVAEEALFRGFIQRELRGMLQSNTSVPYFVREALPIAGATVFFALAHFAGGTTWMILAAVAGTGYGLAYRYGGLLAAVITHGGINSLHFFLLTYPALRVPA